MILGRMARHPSWLLLVPVIAFLLTFFLLPFIWLVRISFARNTGGTGYGEGKAFFEPGTWTLNNYGQFFSDPFFLKIAAFTLQFGLIVAIVSTLVAYLLAYQIYRAPGWRRSVLMLVVILPKFTNVIVLMFGLLVMFGTKGLLNNALLQIGLISEPLPMMFNLFGVVLGETVLVMPYCVLVILAALLSVDRALVDAAGGLGASRLRAFLEVTLPLTLPAVSVSLVLAFMWGAAAFAAPYLLGKPDLYTLAVEVDRQVNWRLSWAMGATVALLLMALIAISLALYVRLQKREARP